MKIKDLDARFRATESQTIKEEQDNIPSTYYNIIDKLPLPYQNIINKYVLNEKVFVDYLRQYDGDINLALLATKNDQQKYNLFDYLGNMLGINYLLNQNIGILMHNYEDLTQRKSLLTRQLEAFIATSNKEDTNIPPKFIMTGDQLMLLMLKTKNTSEETKTIASDGKTIKYATSLKIQVMKSLIKIANYEGDTLTKEELSQIKEVLPSSLADEIIKNMSNGLYITPKIASVLYDLFLYNILTSKDNIAIYEELVSKFELSKSTEVYRNLDKLSKEYK